MPPPRTRRRPRRLIAVLLAVFVAATTSLYLPAAPAYAADMCSVEQWRQDPVGCAGRIPDVLDARKQCLNPPIPAAPDEGLGGWFASEPAAAKQSGVAGMYTDTGYAGFDFVVYDTGCTGSITSPGNEISSTIASWEMMGATAVLGAANAMREKAWAPGGLWNWADPLVTQATTAIYQQVFTVFGVLTLGIVGLWLLWRARHANASQSITIAGWAIFVMVLVTAVARWPVTSAHLADSALTNTVTTVATAVGPQAKKIDPTDCILGPEACEDHRDAPTRAADTTVNTILYRAWLRGTLGSADSPTARKYGWPLHQASTLTWGEARDANDPTLRAQIIERKQDQFKKLGEQLRTEDPAAYSYLAGTRGSDRVGAGFIALLSAIVFAAFDLTSSILILIGFLILRWAVIAAPALGTVALFKPAAAGLKRLFNTVIGSLISVVIFAVGGPAYLSATDMVMTQTSLAGWLQMVLVALFGVTGWILLRPYRKLRGLAGGDPLLAMRGVQGEMHGMQKQMRRQYRRMRRRQRRTQRTARGAEEAAEEAAEILSEEEDWARPEGDVETDLGPVRAYAFRRHYESHRDPRVGAIGVRPYRDGTPAIGPAIDLEDAAGDPAAGNRTRGRAKPDAVVDAELVTDSGRRVEQPPAGGHSAPDVIDVEVIDNPAAGRAHRVWRPGTGYQVIALRPRPAILAGPHNTGTSAGNPAPVLAPYDGEVDL
ncbi:MFS transporter [Krasilnikovia sp. MM14-A1259]|uniref:MFS transporter n=1 Tax=Krasilnikovia sp. MM14-A1259 TaxID=3373539 RepID=UPI0037F3299A